MDFNSEKEEIIRVFKLNYPNNKHDFIKFVVYNYRAKYDLNAAAELTNKYWVDGKNSANLIAKEILKINKINLSKELYKLRVLAINNNLEDEFKTLIELILKDT